MLSFVGKCCLCLSRSQWLTSCFQRLSINLAPYSWSDAIAPSGYSSETNFFFIHLIFVTLYMKSPEASLLWISLVNNFKQPSNNYNKKICRLEFFPMATPLLTYASIFFKDFNLNNWYLILHHLDFCKKSILHLHKHPHVHGKKP